MSLKVFALPASTDVSRVLTCLFEKEVEFQLIQVGTYKKDDEVPKFLRLQDPSGKVALEDNTHHNKRNKQCVHARSRRIPTISGIIGGPDLNLSEFPHP